MPFHNTIPHLLTRPPPTATHLHLMLAVFCARFDVFGGSGDVVTHKELDDVVESHVIVEQRVPVFQLV